MQQNPVTWVVGVDGSEGADRALEWCLAAAPTRAGTVHLLRAWQLPAMYGMEFGAQMVRDLEPESAHPELTGIADRLRLAGVEIDSSVVYGGAASALLDAATSAALLVVGSRGHGGFRRLLVGSVSHQCATHASIPAVVVPDDARTDGVFERVVVGIDNSPGSQAALAWALDFVGDDVDIVATGVFPTSSWTADMDQNLIEQEAQSAEQAFHAVVDEVARASENSTRLRRHYSMGIPGKVLSDASSGSDLIVVGEHAGGRLESLLLGSVATHVLHHAECPVAVIPAASFD